MARRKITKARALESLRRVRAESLTILKQLDALQPATDKHQAMRMQSLVGAAIIADLEAAHKQLLGISRLLRSVNGTKPMTTGAYSQKPYRCTHCGHEAHQGTNHWGETYGPCGNCSWRRPGQPTRHECLEACPEGYTKPAPWKVARLGDVAEIT